MNGSSDLSTPTGTFALRTQGSRPGASGEGALTALGRAGVVMSPEAALGTAIVEVVRHLLQDELAARFDVPRPEPISPWMTPPAASRVSGVPVKSIRAWVRAGFIPKRLRNSSADPRQQKYLVNIDDVVARAEQRGDVGGGGAEGNRARIRAQEILAARAARGR